MASEHRNSTQPEQHEAGGFWNRGDAAANAARQAAAAGQASGEDAAIGDSVDFSLNVQVVDQAIVIGVGHIGKIEIIERNGVVRTNEISGELQAAIFVVGNGRLDSLIFPGLVFGKGVN